MRRLWLRVGSEKERLVTDAKEVGVGNPIEEKTYCHQAVKRLLLILTKVKSFLSGFFAMRFNPISSRAI